MAHEMLTAKSQFLGTDLKPTDAEPGFQTLSTQWPNCHSAHTPPAAVTMDYSEHSKQHFMKFYKIVLF